jgi:hypothetical protein
MVWPFFEEVSHKAPPTHIEGGAFSFCLGKPNSSIVIHSRKQPPCFLVMLLTGENDWPKKKDMICLTSYLDCYGRPPLH